MSWHVCNIYIQDAMFDDRSVCPQEDEMGPVMRKPGIPHWCSRNGNDGQEKNTPRVLLKGHSFFPAEEHNAQKPRIILSDTELDRIGVVVWKLRATTWAEFFVRSNGCAKHCTFGTHQCAQTVFTLVHFNDALLGVHSHVFQISVYVGFSAKCWYFIERYMCCRLVN